MPDAPALDTSGGTHNDPKGSVKWLPAEIEALLDALEELKATNMSGNGFKPQVWAKVVPKVAAVNPDPTTQKDKTQCMGKLSYLKKISVLYIFVRRFTGTGWNDEDKHATNTKDYIEEFTKTPLDPWQGIYPLFHHSLPILDEARCPLRWYGQQATGDNVVHLPTKQRRSRKRPDAATTPSTSLSTSRVPFQPIASGSNNGAGDTSISDDDITLVNPAPMAAFGDAGVGARAFDDELGPVPPSPKTKKRQRADTNDENDDGANDERRKPKRQRSESGGKVRGNAEAGSQISRALENFATVMAQPLVTTEDLSHVTEVVEILKDKTLLPDDLRGRFYRIVSKTLSHDAALARLFILEDDRTRRIGILEGILEDAGVLPQE
ncbi:hypothetical protein C8F04DRAFT_1190509 [Mycena alexandri]|uniref:Myb/SANT-like domain-containing protein n=1 Tax=Mycena alexandri TaxID=1745969 RepID=A0AAD6SFV5_9AGAR|nr:hypothetical protein C8F04DRAFT_1190509 [Mycena alexandri]